MQSLRRRIVSLPTTISETVKETPSKPFVQLGIIMTILFSLAVPALFYFSAQALAEFNTHKLISMQPWLSHYSSKLNNIAVAIVDNIDSAQDMLVPSTQGVKNVAFISKSYKILPQTTVWAHTEAIKFNYALRELSEELTGVEWFVYIHDDTYLFIDNIRSYIQDLDFSKPVLIHNINSTAVDPTNIDPHTSPTMLILSLGGVRKLVSERVKYINCVESMPHGMELGTVIKHCSEELRIKEVRIGAIHATDPTASSEWDLDACSRPLSISRIGSRTQNVLCATTKCNSNAYYSFLFQNAFVPTHQNVVRISSGNGSLVVPRSSVRECMKLCDDDQSCLSWSFEADSCYINADIPGERTVIGAVSGVCKSRYICGSAVDTACNVATSMFGFVKEDTDERADGVNSRRSRRAL